MLLTKATLKGNWGTMLLPLKLNEEIDYPLLDQQISYLIDSKVNGIYSNGTACEFYNQNELEFDRVCALLSEKCKKENMPFQIGVSHMSPIISLERLQRSKHLNPGAFQLILPDWVVTTHEEQLFFLKKMEESAAPIPLVLYNPPHAKQVLRPADFIRLTEHVPGLIGIKVASGDAKWYSEMRDVATHLSVFVPGHRLATGFKEKVGVGSYSNVTCLSPRGAQNWYQLMQTDLEEALLVEKRILNFFDLCIKPFIDAGYSNPALDKFLAAVGGWAPIGTRIRWPYRSISEEEVTPVQKIAKKLLPEFFMNENKF
jgi:4-hydroxy-tetrahydrodipicolinate synthase